MTLKQKRHLKLLKSKFSSRVTFKYNKGVKEHGGNLWEKGAIFLLNEALDENIDQFVYLSTLMDQLKKNDNRNHKSTKETK